MHRLTLLLLVGLIGCAEGNARPAPVAPDRPALAVSAPTAVTATLTGCTKTNAVVLIQWSSPAPYTRIEVSTQGTRDRAGHPFGGWWLASGGSYSATVPFGSYSVYVRAFSAGEMSVEAVTSVDATRKACRAL